MHKLLGKHSDAFYALMRVVVGLLFACHGAQKLFGAFGGMGPHGGTATLVSLMGLAGIIEFFGGVLIALGLFASWAAFFASGEMAWAYFTVHAHGGFWPLLNGGERAVFYCFVFLFIAARGAGKWSLAGGKRGLQ